jgi:hypothetical protein
VPKIPKKIIHTAKVAAPAAVVAATIAPNVPEPVALAPEPPIVIEQPQAEIVAATEPPVAEKVVAEAPVKKSFPIWLYGLGGLLALGAAATAMRMRSKSANQPQAMVNVECAIQIGGSKITAQSSPFVTAI